VHIRQGLCHMGERIFAVKCNKTIYVCVVVGK
jgi:hypothetical protein